MAIILTNCAANLKLINYDNTNPIKIEESARGLAVNEILPSAKDIDGTISIKSIELDISNNLDIGVAYMIEDNLISNLIDNNYRVLERDPDILEALYLESSEKYRKFNESNNDNNATKESGEEGIINISETGEDAVININSPTIPNNDSNSNNTLHRLIMEFTITDNS